MGCLGRGRRKGQSLKHGMGLLWAHCLGHGMEGLSRGLTLSVSKTL